MKRKRKSNAGGEGKETFAEQSGGTKRRVIEPVYATGYHIGI